MAIARAPRTVLDCPDPEVEARFYSALLGWPVTDSDPEWFTIADPGTGQVIDFQRIDGYQAPVWPGQERPQQFHLDVDVTDLDAGETAVLELGATKHEHQPGTTFRVYLDPAGHPFCLCLE